jgi:hypothetical protein
MLSLVERAQEQFDEEEARRIQRKSPKTNLVLMISLPKFNRKKKWVI